MKNKIQPAVSIILLYLAFVLPAYAQGTMFTYQGRVTAGGTAFTGSGQFKFALVTSTNVNHTAAATANINSGFITSYNVTFGGNSYTSAPAVTVSGGGGGSGALATASVSGGAVTSLTANNPGAGYSGVPTVLIAPPPANFSYTTYWSNDGTSVNGSEPTATVSVPVSNGLFTVVLGDPTQPNMTAIPASLFNQINLQLRIWFNDGAHGWAALDPAQSLTPTPYAVFANTASNLVNGLMVQQNTNGAPNVIGGASVNYVSNSVVGATIAGGGAIKYNGVSFTNSITGNFGTVSGGAVNIASASFATVSGGYYNTASGGNATVSGGDDNTASGLDATVSGGFSNTASDAEATVGGGLGNTASDYAATVSGGYVNTASGGFATVGGGIYNSASNNYATVSGGYHNNANGYSATIAGGTNNTAGLESAVGGGNGNAASGWRTTVGGGYKNTASADYATVSGGNGNTASALYATVAGGNGNTASGIASFAAGYTAQASHQGAFVWSDYTSGTFSSSANNQFSVRATGGYRFYTSASAGAQLAAGATSWSALSDRNAKKNFAPASLELILDKLVQIPIEQWNYKWESDSDVPNIGPMAQDFKAAFYPGRDDKSISTLEFDGVELAAIQGLNAKVESRSQELEVRNDKSEQRIQQLEAENARLRGDLDELKSIVKSLNDKQNGIVK